MSMNKETKIGLAVIAVLGIIFCAVLIRKFMGGGDSPPVANASPNTSQATHSDTHAAGKPLPPPTIVQDHAGTANAPKTTVPHAKAIAGDEYRSGHNKYEDYQGSSRRTVGAALLPQDDQNQQKAKTDQYKEYQPPAALTPNLQVTESVNQAPSYAKQQNTPRELNLNIGPPVSNQQHNQTQQNPQHQHNVRNNQGWQSNQSHGKSADHNPYRPRNNNLVATPTAAQVPVDSFRRRGVADLDNPNQSTQQPSRPNDGQNVNQNVQQRTPQNAQQTQPYRPSTKTHQVADDEPLDNRFDKTSLRSRPSSGLYVVQPNDNFWSISRTVYGTGGFYKALVKHNQQKHPRPSQIQVGDEVEVPQIAELRKKYPEFCPKDRSNGIGTKVKMASHKKYFGPTRVYVVEQGDTLSDIAKYELGKVSKWDVIYHLNRDKLGNDFNHLKPGTRLTIPDVRNDSRQSPKQEQPSGRVAREIDYEQTR